MEPNALDLDAVGSAVLVAAALKFFPDSPPKSISLALKRTDAGYFGRFKVESEYGELDAGFFDQRSRTEAQLTKAILKILGEVLS